LDDLPCDGHRFRQVRQALDIPNEILQRA